MAKRDKLLSKAYAELCRTCGWQRIYSLFIPEGKKSGDWINASCPLPSHRGKDSNASFGYNCSEGTYNCFVCGGGDAIDFLIHMGLGYDNAKDLLLKESGLSKDSSYNKYSSEGHFPFKRTKDGSLKYVEGYIYEKNGLPLYRKNRYEKSDHQTKIKVFDFWIYSNGAWHLSSKKNPLKPANRVLFNAEAVDMARNTGRPLYVVEGEKDVNTMKKLGLLTVSAGGVNDWQEHFAAAFDGLKVYVIPDNDRPGQNAAKRIFADLNNRNVDVSMFTWERCSEQFSYPGGIKDSHGEDITDLYEHMLTLDTVLNEALVLSCCETSIENPSSSDKEFIELPLNDVGNARRLIKLFGDDIRYCHEWNAWLIFNGYWVEDKTGEIYAKAREVICEMARLGLETENELLVKFALKSGFNGRISAMEEQAQSHSEFGIPVASQVWDRNDSLICLKDCTVNLLIGEKDMTFEVKEHHREDYITKQMPITYQQNATCERWLEFLSDILPDTETREFVKRAIGYSLTGDTSEDVMFILYGTGSNGKSTFVETISSMLGDYAKTINPETLLHKDKTYGPNTEIAGLCGARFVRCSEQDEGRRLSESLIKQLTSGEPVSTRHLYGRDFTYLPTYKIWFSTNHKPSIHGTDDGIWRRICLIPFEVCIPEEKRDVHLDLKLKEELPGILNWAIEGLVEYKRIGLKPPQKVCGAVKSYRAEQDILGGFIEDVLVSAAGYTVMANRLFRAYEQYCDKNGLFKLSQTKFGTKLSDRGYQKYKTAGIIHYKDMKIADGWNPDDFTPTYDDKDCPFN